jgi:hypothetical protein
MASPTPVLQPAVVSAVSSHRKKLLPIRAGSTASSEARPSSSVPSASVSCTGPTERAERRGLSLINGWAEGPASAGSD